MSGFLDFFRSPKTPWKSLHKDHNDENFFKDTEMGVFTRSSGKGTELQNLRLNSVASEQLDVADLTCSPLQELPETRKVPEAEPPIFAVAKGPPATEAILVLELLRSFAANKIDGLASITLEQLCWSGCIFCMLLSNALPGSLDLRAINDDRDKLTDDEVQENLQLCHSCALAEGCDVSGITTNQLSACEITALTDFVFEVLRVSALKALPARDRQWFAQPAPAEPLVGTSEAAFTAAHGSGPRPEPAGFHTGQGQGSFRGPRVDVAVRGADATSGTEPATCGSAASSAVARAPGGACGRHLATAAAHRAEAGLTQWVLQLVGNTGASSSCGPSCSGNTDGSSSHGALPTRGAVTAAVAGCLDAAGVASVSNQVGVAAPQTPVIVNMESATAEAAAGKEATTGSTFDSGVADPLVLEAWERLVAWLSCGNLTSEASKGNSDLATTTMAATTEARWAAAAAGLSRCLSSSRGVRAHCPGASAASSTAAMPPPLPDLRAEDLRCWHPGLRSVILSYALVAHFRATEGLQIFETTPVVGTDGVRSGAATSGSSSSSSSSGGSMAAADEGIGASGSAIDEATLSIRLAGQGTSAAAAVKPPPASPAPPLPFTRTQSSVSAAAAALRGTRTTGGGGFAGWLHPDVLTEHNKLVAREHEQRERRRQHQSAAGAGAAGSKVPGMAGGLRGAPAASGVGAGEHMLWTGEDDETMQEDQEERVLRLWLNSLHPGIQVTSLFEQGVATGWPLLQALEAIQPGCVPWADAFRPPFKEKLWKILSVQNCNLVIEVCTRQLAMPPLVNIGGLDLALGHRRATLSLVFQMMRHHMAMLLGLAAPGSPPATPGTPGPLLGPTIPESPCTPSAAESSLVHDHSYPPPHQHPHQHQGAAAVPPGAAAGGQPAQQRAHGHGRAHLEVEKAVLAWANTKLAEAAASEAASATARAGEDGGAAAAEAAVEPFVPLSGFSDPRLGEGRVLLQLLGTICPRTVNPKYVMPGRTAEERGSNARYLLSCARKIGCVIFLVWEDVVAARPRLLLPLLASFMALDRKRAAAAATSTDIQGSVTGAN